MIARLGDDVTRAAFRLILRLWPLWLFWFAWRLSDQLWARHLQSFSDRSSDGYAFAYHAWPAASLAGPVLIAIGAAAAVRANLTTRLMGIAGIVGLMIATLLTLQPECARIGQLVSQDGLIGTLFGDLGGNDIAYLVALATGLLGTMIATQLLRAMPFFGKVTGTRGRTAPRIRAQSDNFGHADWLSMKDARRLFPGPDPAHGGLVVGEAYRVDQDRVAGRAFDPADRGSWGTGGKAPLLVDPCRSGSTHALVFAGSGGFKTTSVGVPTLLSWTGAAVVLDPSRELGPMLTLFRQDTLGQHVAVLDPADAAACAFNVLDWIDITAPLAETNVEAVVGWITGETPRGNVTSGGDFFRDSGKSLITCLLADLLWDPSLPLANKTLRTLRQRIATPENEIRTRLEEIHAGSASYMARDLAGMLKGLVAETFSGIYANAGKETRWLAVPAYADLVSGSSFRTRDLVGGKLTVFVQVPLKTLLATPALGRVIIGSLLNAAYEADGAVQGRILFLLDEVARLGPMAILEQARDAGRKYGITLLLLYQSLGQLAEQWGRAGKQAWYDSTSWRLYAAIQDPETARELSLLCGEHGVVATAHGDTTGSQARADAAFASSSSGRSENRSEIQRRLIKPDELLQDTRADEAFVIVRGARPLRCGRAVYFRRPEWKGRVGANRFHQDAAE